MGTAMESTASRVSEPDSFIGELLSARLYKPNQGRIARQVTCGAIWLGFAIAAWRWFETRYGFMWLGDYVNAATWDTLRYALPGLLLLVGVWFGYRLVNWPKFADFLIAVEAEMNKVTWPSQDELVRSSVVVIIMLVLFTLVLYSFDIIWYQVFVWLGIRPPPGPPA
jgi:preprotein translocase subunit SecE